MFNRPGISVVDVNAHKKHYVAEHPPQNQYKKHNFKNHIPNNNIQIINNSNRSGELPGQSLKKVPSIFKRIFKEKQQPNLVMQSQLYSSNFSPQSSNITHLKTNHFEGAPQGIIVDHPIQLPQLIPNNQLTQPARIIQSPNLIQPSQFVITPQHAQPRDACNRCLISPAEVSVTNLKENRSERLCAACHQSSKQTKNYIKSADMVTKYKCVYREEEPKVENHQKTVIVMQGTKEGEKANSNKVLVGLSQPLSSNIEEIKNETNQKIENVQQEKLRVSKLSFQPSFQRGNSKPNFQARIVTNTIKNWNNSSSTDNLAPNLEEIFDGARNSREVLHDIAPSNTEVLYASSSRPSAFNPEYRGTEENYQHVDLPSELEAPFQSTQFFSKIEEIRHNEMMQNHRIKETQENFPAPPRYEDIVKNPVPKNSLGFISAQLLHSIGKASKQPQPGGINSPTFIKFSAQNTPNNGVLVVTDPIVKCIQVFDTEGRCQAMVRIDGLICACASTNNMILAACEDKVALLRFDGSEKASIFIDTADGGEVTAITRFRNNPSFAVLAQKHKVSLLECDFQGIFVSKSFSTVGSGKRFQGVVDVAMTSKDDIVVLDRSREQVDIYVLDVGSGQLKSAISPRHESCGPMASPTSISLDENNSIYVTDTIQKRVLMFSVQMKSNSKNEIVVKEIGGFGEISAPACMAVMKTGMCFVVLMSDLDCNIGVFSYNK